MTYLTANLFQSIEDISAEFSAYIRELFSQYIDDGDNEKTIEYENSTEYVVLSILNMPGQTEKSLHVQFGHQTNFGRSPMGGMVASWNDYSGVTGIETIHAANHIISLAEMHMVLKRMVNRMMKIDLSSEWLEGYKKLATG